jgi:dihydroorotase
MSLLLNSLIVSDSSSKFYNKKINILIGSDGIIQKISKNKIDYKSKKTINCKEKKVSVGWIDFSSNFCDPGYEYKEDLTSGINLASKSGFVDILLNSNTNPVIQNKNDISYIKNKSDNKLVSVYPTAEITKDSNGIDMNDIIDLHTSGAIAFSGGNSIIKNSEMILKSLQYLNQIDGLYISKPNDYNLSKGQVNDSINGNKVGLKGIPYISEVIGIQRDLSILEYVGGKIHFSGVSTKQSVKLIKKAKLKGLNVTCDVPIYNLLLDDSKILNFDTNFKVDPPLRSKEDIDFLISALKDGTIDVISSNHQPQDIDSKNIEFDKASFGIISLQTFFSNLVELSSKVSFDILLEKFTKNPRKILKINQHEIKVGSKAVLTVFDQNSSWDFNENTNFSKSINSPWMNWSLKGKVEGVVVGCETNIEL